MVSSWQYQNPFYVLTSETYGTLTRLVWDTNELGLIPCDGDLAPIGSVSTSRTPNAVILKAINPPIVHMIVPLQKPRSAPGRIAFKGFSSKVDGSGVKPCSATSAIVPPSTDHA